MKQHIPLFLCLQWNQAFVSMLVMVPVPCSLDNLGDDDIFGTGHGGWLYEVFIIDVGT